MYCAYCGSVIPADGRVCPACGRAVTNGVQQYTPPAPGVSIPNYLVQAILVTICCCLPLGIVAIVYAAQVDSKVRIGDIAGAQQSSDNARTWCWVAFGAGVIGTVIGLLIQFGMMSAGHARF